MNSDFMLRLRKYAKKAMDLPIKTEVVSVYEARTMTEVYLVELIDDIQKAADSFHERSPQRQGLKDAQAIVRLYLNQMGR